jgi:hypothetical protein
VIPNEQWRQEANGEINVRFANYVVPTQGGAGEPIYGSYTKGDGLIRTINQMVEDYGAEIGGEDPAATVDKAIREGFDAARAAVVGQKELLKEDGYDRPSQDCGIDSIIRVRGFS